MGLVSVLPELETGQAGSRVWKPLKREVSHGLIIAALAQQTPARAGDRIMFEGLRPSGRAGHQGSLLQEASKQRLGEVVIFSNAQISAKNYKGYKEIGKCDPIKGTKQNSRNQP